MPASNMQCAYNVSYVYIVNHIKACHGATLFSIITLKWNILLAHL